MSIILCQIRKIIITYIIISYFCLFEKEIFDFSEVNEMKSSPFSKNGSIFEYFSVEEKFFSSLSRVIKIKEWRKL